MEEYRAIIALQDQGRLRVHAVKILFGGFSLAMAMRHSRRYALLCPPDGYKIPKSPSFDETQSLSSYCFLIFVV